MFNSILKKCYQNIRRLNSESCLHAQCKKGICPVFSVISSADAEEDGSDQIKISKIDPITKQNSSVLSISGYCWQAMTNKQKG